jgi:serpin B
MFRSRLLVPFGLSAGLAGCVSGHDPLDTADSADPTVDDTAADCTAEPNVRATPTPAEAAAARSANQLGVGLLRERTDENPFLAPLNITTALGMLLAGAEGATAEEIRAVLAAEGTDDELHAGLAGLDAALTAASDAGSTECPTWSFAGANAAFVDQRLALTAAFSATLADPYDAAPTTVDYENDPIGAADAINTWASDHTAGHIDAIASPDAYTYRTLLVLASAVWFDGKWTDPFSTADTLTEPFALADGGTVDVPMMRNTAGRAWGAIDGATLVELPYRGDDLAMVLVVPDATDGLDAVLASLDPASLDAAALDAFGPSQIEVVMPRFTLRSHASLNAPLAALGMPTAFDEVLAELRGIAPPPPGFDNLYVDEVVHSAWVDVSESGTEAAAATTIEIDGSDSAAAPPPSVRADHPFLYVIRDRVTGAWLFAGRMDNPPVSE